MGLLPLWTECENMLMGRSLSLIKPWISCLKKIRKEQSYFQICPFTSQAVMIFLFVCFVLWKNAMGDLGSFSSSWKSLCSPVQLEPASVTVKAVVCPCSSEEMASVKVRPWLLWRFCSLLRHPYQRGGGERRSRDAKNPCWCQVLAWVPFSICSKRYKCRRMPCFTEVFTRVAP